MIAQILASARSCGKYMLEILVGTDLPVWVTLLGVFGGVYGTYALLPGINQEFERQKIKSEFVIRNLDDLNVKTRSLIADLTKMHNTIQSGGRLLPAEIQTFLPKIAELQWKAIELAVIFEKTSSMDLVEKYQQSLDEIRTAAINLSDKKSVEKSIGAVEAFSLVSIDIMKSLVGIAGLKPTLRAPLVK